MLALFWQDVVDHIEQWADLDLQPIFFADFAAQGVGQPLAKLDGPAWKFPQATLVLCQRAALRQEQLPALIGNDCPNTHPDVINPSFQSANPLEIWKYTLIMPDDTMRKASPKRYPIPAGEARAEITVINSRFIASLAPAFSVEEARAFINRIKAEFADASHNVPAFLIGYGPSLTAHCTDDGEPSGTAGRPALAVLQGSGLGDVVVVVTRYFGGTKLGTGGLVHAYSEAVKAVLVNLPRAEKIPTYTVMLACEYALFERIRLLIQSHRGEILDEDFGADVTVTARFAVWHLEPFQSALRELSRGALQAEIIETNPETIMPLGSFLNEAAGPDG